MSTKLTAFAALVLSAASLAAHAGPANVYTEAGVDGGPAHAVLVSADGVLAEADLKPNPFAEAYFTNGKTGKHSVRIPNTAPALLKASQHVEQSVNEPSKFPAPARTYTEAGTTKSTYSKITVDDKGLVAQADIDKNDFSSASFPNAKIADKLKAKVQKTASHANPAKPKGSGI